MDSVQNQNTVSSILSRESVYIVGKLLDLGFCIVPSNILDKNGKKKVPWWDWKKIREPLSGTKLFDAISDSGADSLAVRAGKISCGFGGFSALVIIDIDTKYKEGIDAEIFSEILLLYPELWEKIRREKTPSGGYHLYYRVVLDDNDEPSEFGAIASRFPTESELAKKPKTKTYSFVELKDIAQCYPSPGYQLLRGGIEDISWNEHCSIVKLLKGYDELYKEDEEKYEKGWIKDNRKDFDMYEESPWKCFNQGREADSVLENYGDWVVKDRSKNKPNSAFKYYARKVGGKDDDAVYRRGNNRYRIYTLSSNLEAKSYTPVNLLCEVKFGGNRSECFSWLVSNGYGKIKEYRENALIKRALTSGKELPANISAKAIEKFKEQKKDINTKFPHGLFWEEDFNIKLGESKFNISRDKIYSVSEGLGFSVRENLNDICYVEKDSDFVEIVDKRVFFDKLKLYIADSGIEVIDCFEAFLQKSGDFTITRLPIFNENLLLRSEKDISYKFYKNGFVEIDLREIRFKKYSELNGKLIWKHDIQNRDYIEFGEISDFDWKIGYYYDFLSKAIFGGVSPYLLNCIGYYAHDYKATTTPYIVVLCETCENPAQGAGSGKNIFTNLLNFTSSVLNKPATNVKFDDTLLRTRKQQKIISLNDAEKKFNYMGLRELSSGDGEVGKKFKQEETILAKNMPKFIVNTNFSFDPSLPGLKRRLIPVEFTEFFTRKGGVDIHYGVDFPTDSNSSHGWTEKDWISYDYIILKSIQEFIKNGCKLYLTNLSDGGWSKQFCQRFGATTLDFIKEYIEDWILLVDVPINEVFNIQKDSFYKENGTAQHFQIGSIKMNEALKEYCDHHNIEFTPTKNLGKIGLKQTNGKVFKRKLKDGSVEELIKEIVYEDVPEF